MAESPSERIINALIGKAARPSMMEPSLLQAIGAAPPVYPPGAFMDELGRIVDRDGNPFPVSRRPNILPVTRDAEGNAILAWPKLPDILGLLGPVSRTLASSAITKLRDSGQFTVPLTRDPQYDDYTPPLSDLIP